MLQTLEDSVLARCKLFYKVAIVCPIVLKYGMLVTHRDVRQWLATFPFPLILSVHSQSQTHGASNVITCCVSYYYKFVTPLYLWSGKAIESSNLVCRLTASLQTNKCKSTSIGAWPTSRELLLQFLDPSLSLEWVTRMKL